MPNLLCSFLFLFLLLLFVVFLLYLSWYNVIKWISQDLKGPSENKSIVLAKTWKVQVKISLLFISQDLKGPCEDNVLLRQTLKDQVNTCLLYKTWSIQAQTWITVESIREYWFSLWQSLEFYFAQASFKILEKFPKTEASATGMPDMKH